MSTATSTKRRVARQRQTTGSKTARKAPEHQLLRGPVVLATRGSQDSKSAALVAKQIAKKLNRRLEIVSVVEPALLYGLPPDAQASSISIDHEARDARERDIRGPFAEVIGRRGDWTHDVRIGQPAAEICDAARDADATVIVVGSSPHRRMRRIVAGKRAAQILHHAGSPVLAVAPWLKDLPHNCVAAIDFSAASIRAAQAALLIMDKGARLALVHVMPESYFRPVPNSEDAKLRIKVMEQLEEIRSQLLEQAPGAEISTTVLHGEPATETLNHAESVDADLLATGTHGRPALVRMLVGSVATELLHGAPCSVLASPPPPVSEELDQRLRTQGTVVTTDTSEYAPILDSFSARNNGKRVSLEEDDKQLGAQLQVQGYVLRGTAWDAADGRVDLMLAPSMNGTVHLTRTIPGVSGVGVTTDAKGNDLALQIRHGKAQTLLLLHDSKKG